MIMEEQADDVSSLVSLLNRRITFAAYSLPGNVALNYIVDDNVSPIVSSRRFVITAWNGETVEIFDRADISHVAASQCGRHAPVQGISTSWADYESAVNRVVSLLKTTQGKVVISRLKILSDSRLDYLLIAKSLKKCSGNIGMLFVQYIILLLQVHGVYALRNYFCTSTKNRANCTRSL